MTWALRRLRQEDERLQEEKLEEEKEEKEEEEEEDMWVPKRKVQAIEGMGGHTVKHQVNRVAEGAETCGLEMVSMEKSKHGSIRRRRKGRINSLRGIELPGPEVTNQGTVAIEGELESWW